MKLHVGTSGFSYKEWKGSFYPEKIKNADMLAFYAEQLGAVEINNTFYRMPKPELLEGWMEKTPADFRFVLKASQRLTHHRRLKDADEPLEYWTRTVRVMGERLGPTLFQLPPNFKADEARLRDFLSLLPAGFRAAFEFRHASWVNDEVMDALRTAGAAWVIADAEDETLLRVERTAPFVYVRLRRVDYDTGAVRDWVGRLRALDADELYVFFKHEDEGTGPALALQFAEHFDAS